MKLHESPSPNARRVHIFMAEKGIDCERVAVDIRGGENISAEYLAKNPGGRVPMLELDDGTFIGESIAICRYLEGLHPQPCLFGDTPLACAQIEMWQRRVELNLLMDVAGAFRNLSGVFKDRETCVKEWGEVCALKIPKTLTMFDDQLAERTYLAGDDFSVADITLIVTLDFANRVKVATLPELPNIAR
ncbi:MAG: glutathione S-transferase family protein, partial [Pseudomonadales bacterium]|nr:glutathione S-transferase family protein [Pseudomonadales bacterium]